MPDENDIRQRAYAIWEEDGRPEGRQEEHWQRASMELAGTGLSMDLDKGTIAPDGQPATAPADGDDAAAGTGPGVGETRRGTMPAARAGK